MSGYELYHFGIKGMKWGIRRYQNDDGTYTELGKKRRRSGRIGTRITNVVGHRSSKTLSQARKTHVDDLSTEELQKIVLRMNLEKQYKSLTKSDAVQALSIGKRILAATSGALVADMIKNGPNKIKAGAAFAAAFGAWAFTRAFGEETYTPYNPNAIPIEDYGGAYHSGIRSDYLCHYGILGMKWGIRRYQNEDGSYTEAGKRRYYGKYASESDVQHYRNRLKDTKPFSRERAAAKEDLRRVESDYAREQEIKNDFYSGGWTSVHNAAAASSQSGLDKLNKKYKAITSENAEAYAREYAKLWNDALASELTAKYGERFKPSELPTYWGEQTIKEFISYNE